MYIVKAIASLVIVCAVVAGGLVLWSAVAPRGPEPVAPIAGTPTDLPPGMSRGEYLTRAADCVACHTGKGGPPYTGGRAFHLDFGTIYATNLTPDMETGIGTWSDDEFVAAVREGKGRHGNLYPAMPYTSYAGLSREDVLLMKQYLMALEPVHNRTPENELAFPFNQRWGMTFWNAAFFRERRNIPEPSKTDEINRGQYLATALGHCGECHTPRNIGMAMKSRDFLSGTIVEGWKAYNTTSDTAYGVGGWSDEQLKSYLSKGHAPGRSTASGPMAEVVELSLQYLTPSDISALAGYMRSVEPATGDGNFSITLQSDAVKASGALTPGQGSSGIPTRGERLFAGDCAGCHQWNGVGRQSDFASLAGSRAVNDPSGTALAQVILNGTEITVGGRKHFMPGFGGSYSDADVAAVANYVLQHFGGRTGQVNADQVRQGRETQH